LNKIIIVNILLASTLFARFEATAIQECQAYNDMKHKKNSGHISIVLDKSYTIIKRYKGQHQTLVPDANPVQRWVDSSCFGAKSLSQKPKVKSVNNSTKPTQSLLALSWQNAFCQTHKYKAECKRATSRDRGQLTLHGLWPQPKSNSYCNLPRDTVAKDKHHQWRELPDISLSSSTLTSMQSYMPGYKSGLHKHEWYKHGTCYGTDANTYFGNALKLAREVDSSSIGKLIRSKEGKSITLAEIRQAFDREYGKPSGKKVQMRCKGGLLTELWVNLSGRGDNISSLIKNGKNTKSRCDKARVDRAGY
jgi:ribonuclease T2